MRLDLGIFAHRRLYNPRKEIQFAGLFCRDVFWHRIRLEPSKKTIVTVFPGLDKEKWTCDDRENCEGQE